MSLDIVMPDYNGGSIVNLMSSIAIACAHKPVYKPLKNLKTSELDSKNIVLMVLDGLGYDFIKKHGKGGFLHSNMRFPITSVFPSTTAACITTFATGLAPQQHAITGWFMHVKELGSVAVCLPYTPRGQPFYYHLNPKVLFDQKPFVEKLKVKTYIITAYDIVNSHFTYASAGKAKRFAYTTMDGYFRAISKVSALPGRKFIYAYWPEFDRICHHNGVESKKALAHFKMLDRKISNFTKSLKSTTVVMTADHGMVDVPKQKTIELNNHPILEECLSIPLCGEPRAAYCYVRPSKAKQFENYIRTKMKGKCRLIESEHAIAKNYFGLFKPNPKLKHRIGDYILLMEDNYIIKDFLITENKNFMVGTHGGLSRKEMLVPFILFKS